MKADIPVNEVCMMTLWLQSNPHGSRIDRSYTLYSLEGQDSLVYTHEAVK